VFAVVVIGPPGSGKTSVLTALHDGLVAGDVAHAVIEVEAVAWGHPNPSDEQSFRHLETLCRAYEAAGSELILVGATATSAGYLAALIAAIGAEDRLVVRLEADPATMRERIREREPAEWSGLDELVGRVDEIARASRALEAVDLVCSTENTCAFAVAERIRRARRTSSEKRAPRRLTPRWRGAQAAHRSQART
jgi:shikimate kinase